MCACGMLFAHSLTHKLCGSSLVVQPISSDQALMLSVFDGLMLRAIPQLLCAFAFSPSHENPKLHCL